MADDPKDDAGQDPENRDVTGEGDKPPPGVRDQGGRFAAGSTGNPGGRPKTPKEFKELARDYSALALKKLYTIALAPGSGMAQVRACEIIIERAWGRVAPAQAGPKGGPVDGRFYDAARNAVEEAIAKAKAAAAADQERAEDGPKN